MADRYWVGGTASWDGTAGTKWALTSGGAGGQAVPTAADDVFFDANSGASTVTISAGNTGAKSITCTGFTGTITGTAAITVSGSVTLVAGMTYTHTGTMTFNATATLTSAGKVFSGIIVNGAGITFTLNGDLDISNRNLDVTQGTFNTANFNIIAGSFSSSNFNTRTITFGSSTVTLTNTGVAFSFAINLSLTFNANTSQINFTGSSVVFATGGKTFNNVSFNSTSAGGSCAFNGGGTFNNLTLSAPATPGFIRYSTLNSNTITGTLTCAGASALRRVFLSSDTIGSTRTFTVGTLSANDCDFRDITLAGAASPASPTRAGNCGGNTNITFPAAKTVYRVGTNTSWAGSASWATSSGGAGADTNFPLPQDTAVIDNSTTLTGTLTLDTYNYSALDASTRTTGITLDHSTAVDRYGSYALGSGVTISGTSTQTFAGRGTMDFTSAGKTITFPITVNAPGGTFRLLDATTLSNTFTVTRGTLNLNNLTLTSTGFFSSNSNTRTLDFGTGNITVSGTGLVFSTQAATGLTVTGTPVVNVTNTTATATSVEAPSGGNATEATSISFNFKAGTYTVGIAGGAYRSLDFTGFAGTWNIGSTGRSIYGDLKISTGMTLGGGSNAQTFASTSATVRTITTNGKTFLCPFTINGVGGTFRLLDNFTASFIGGTFFTHTNGTLDLNGFNLTIDQPYVTAAGTKNLTFNGGTLTVSASGSTAFNNAAPTNFTTTAGTGTGTISMTSASAKTFVGGGSTYNCTLNNGGAGALTITGSNTFTTLANSVQPTTFTFTAGTTTTLTNWNISGTAGNLVTIGSATAASHTLSKASGTVSANYLSISRSTATGGATWNASNSTDGGNNSGWNFGGGPIYVDGQAVIDGIGSVTALGLRIQAGQAAIDGIADLAAAAQRIQAGQVAMDGIANLTGSAQAVLGGSAFIEGVGSVIPSAVVIYLSAAAIDGSGSVVVAGGLIQNFSVVINAAGEVQIIGTIKWEQVPDGIETWNQAADSATTWTPVSAGSEDWTRIQ